MHRTTEGHPTRTTRGKGEGHIAERNVSRKTSAPAMYAKSGYEIISLMGRPAKSSQLRIAEGMRGHHPLRKEAQHKFGCPERPKGMSRAAARVWDRLIEQLDPLTLRLTDENALATLCEGEAQLTEAYAGLREKAEELKAKAKAEGRELPGGATFALMADKESAMAVRALRNLERSVVVQRREFGLTPSSRSRIGPGDAAGTPDMLDEVLSRPVERFV